ncbi:MAG: branched-chain amino acid ABC transporter permease [Pseudomonadota bacterium]|jgi:branched-chain amino acid transport system permease protein|nr:branched-chain amino acid ABC transporter permease [Pseudomonadota bacterium]
MRLKPTGILLLVLFVAAVLLPLGLDPRGNWLRVMGTVMIFAAAAQAWNIMGGLANQVSLGHAAFFGIGAYVSTLLYINFGISPWIGMLIGALVAAGAGALICLPTLRLTGHYFALATLAFAEVCRVIANSWSSVTGGPVGLTIPFAGDAPLLFQFRSTVPYYYIILALLVVVSVVFWRIQVGAFGYRLRALRETPEAASVVGVNVFRTKMIATMISAALTALCGTVFVQFTFFFDPDSVFSLTTISIRLAMIAIVGGLGTLIGPIIGALFLLPLEEVAITLLSSQASGVAQLAFGVVLIAAILIQPRGLVALGPWIMRRLKRDQPSAPSDMTAKGETNV